jgi:hypothetical protein
MRPDDGQSYGDVRQETALKTHIRSTGVDYGGPTVNNISLQAV